MKALKIIFSLLYLFIESMFILALLILVALPTSFLMLFGFINLKKTNHAITNKKHFQPRADQLN